MLTYLCHGFRWHRRGIRFVTVHDLEDAAPDWIVGRTSASLILDQFRHAYDFLPSRPLAAATRTEEERQKQTLHRDHDLSPPPSRVPASDDEVLMHDWSPVKLLEEYDVDETSASRPYAYVADHAVRVDLGANVATEMAKYQSMAGEGGHGWFDKLREKLQAGEDIQWYVVVCGDGERAVPEGEPGDDEDGTDQEEEEERHWEEDLGEEELPPPTKDYPMRIRQKQQQAAPPRPVETDRPTPARVSDKAGHVATPGRHSPPRERIADGPSEATSPQPGPRHTLSTKGLRRLFSKSGDDKRNFNLLRSFVGR